MCTLRGVERILLFSAYRFFSTQWPPAFSADNPSSLKNGYLKSFPPQRPLEDMQIISAIFADSVISEGFGKYCIPQPKTIRYGLLLVNFFQKSRILAGCKLIGIAIELIWRHSLLF